MMGLELYTLKIKDIFEFSRLISGMDIKGNLITIFNSDGDPVDVPDPITSDYFTYDNGIDFTILTQIPINELAEREFYLKFDREVFRRFVNGRTVSLDDLCRLDVTDNKLKSTYFNDERTVNDYFATIFDYTGKTEDLSTLMGLLERIYI